MTRSTLLYLGMFVVLGGGLEVIRRVGNTLTPPRHIAGQWHLTASPSFSSCPMLEFAGAGKAELFIEQSGRYLTLNFTDVHMTRLRAHFDDGVVRGSGFSVLPCAIGKRLDVTGRLKNGRLELTLTRSQGAPMPAASALVLFATRVSDTNLPSSSSP
jgi:hypothetical protein